MTIDKAIKLLTLWHNHASPTLKEDYKDALKLGLEALKLVREFRTGRYKTINSPLLGETE